MDHEASAALSMRASGSSQSLSFFAWVMKRLAFTA